MPWIVDIRRKDVPSVPNAVRLLAPWGIFLESVDLISNLERDDFSIKHLIIGRSFGNGRESITSGDSGVSTGG